jgi:hypothetical protein
MLFRKTIVLLLSVSAVLCGLQGQIYAPAANDSFIARYGTDQVFIFNKPEYRAELTGAIIAIPSDHLSGWTFQWAVYDPNDSAYTSLPFVVTGETSMIDTITVSAGYQVTMTKGLTVETFRVWVVFNDLDLHITNKDEENNLLFGYYNCTSLDLRADTVRPAPFYYNPQTHAKLDAENLYTKKWKTDNAEASNPPDRFFARVTDPPWQDTWYTLTVSDNYGLNRKDSVFYKSIQSHAEMTTSYIPLTDDSTTYPGTWIDMFYDYDKHSAPGKFSFDLSGSRNLVSFQLDFGDGDSIISGIDSLILIHEYQEPGIYSVLLTTKSAPPFECIDTIRLDKANALIMDAATQTEFKMPNVFTPDRDKNYVFKQFEDTPGTVTNDIFRSSEVSVIYIDITIFSRTGLKVHEFKGNMRDWQGWDGQIKDSNRKAPEGVYFYVITSLVAYQDSVDPINRGMLKGFFHLYRE